MLESDQNYIPEEEVVPRKKLEIKPEQKKKIAYYTQIAFFVLLLLFIGYYAYWFFSQINRNGDGNLTPSPVASPTPTAKPKILTKWATDSAILNIQNTLQQEESSLKNLDLSEQSLSFPALDFSLNFNEKQ